MPLSPTAAFAALGNNNGLIYITPPSGLLTWFSDPDGMYVTTVASAPYVTLQDALYNTEFGRERVMAHFGNINRDRGGARGFRVFLNVDADWATRDVDFAAAVEITDLCSITSLDMAPVIVDGVVASNTITETRLASIQTVRVDGITTAGNANQVTDIVYEGWQAGDILVLTGIDGAVPPVIMRTPGVIEITAPSLTLNDDAGSLWLRLGPTGTFLEAFSWPAAADLRTEGINIPAQAGVFDLVPAGGVATLSPGLTGTSAFPGDIYEANISMSGGPVVLAASLNFAVATLDSLNGDSGTISANGVSIDLNGNSINFSDPTQTRITITPELALSGLWSVQWVVQDALNEIVSFALVPNFGTQNTGFIIGDMIADDTIPNVKLQTGISGTKISAGTIPITALDATTAAKVNALNFSNVTMGANITASDRQALWMDCTIGPLTVTLPAVSPGAPFQEIRVSKTDAGADIVSVSGNGNTINGLATNTDCAAQYDQVIFTWNGAEWFAK